MSYDFLKINKENINNWYKTRLETQLGNLNKAIDDFINCVYKETKLEKFERIIDNFFQKIKNLLKSPRF